ncbi:hypothetical protein [Oharaeibacter diazotrophicus]|uniref:AsmA-like protein n=1 Tax=Oharaeibacter diazotrophicus TaxID=1920512 RepID=A0A4R6RLM6_9HYPH|nr:hypothetical protein [Oharaeibacter diazotrophicus]TDP87402.1 hypothetical protein EDD54_1296 [Oharaeibacter diazotrophicus]BBE70655.1 hypothetical protein OHA_1_00219 [Pleomorphomonas sp. SM30]GLS77401.1 membrane protein [Oharaeibacter diazotrophicus]
MNFPRSAKAGVAALAIGAFTTLPGWAATDQEITDALTKFSKAGDDKAVVELGTPKREGDALIYGNVVVKDQGGTRETRIATLKLVNADLNGKGGLKADSLTAEGISGTSGDTAAKAESLEIVNFDATPPAAPGGEGKGRMDSLTITAMEITEKDKPPVTIGSLGVEASDFVDDYPHTLSLSVENIVVDPATAAAGGIDTAPLKALGYDKLNLSVYAGGAWDQPSGTLTLDEFSVEGADMGTLTLTGTIGGVTADVMKALGQPNPPPDLITKLTLSDASLTYEDASLTGRVLDMQAKQMGQEKEAFVGQITAALPMMLAALQNPPFQDKVAAAAGAFLKDPKNLQITVAPEKPVPVAEIVGTAQTAPQTLPDALKADVQANVELEE